MTLSEIRKLNPFKENTQKHRIFKGLVTKVHKHRFHPDFNYIAEFHARLTEIAREMPKELRIVEGKKLDNGCKTYRIEER